MQRSLSVLLPVRNAQDTLADTVSELLEVLPELTSMFELVIVDDGSSDATLEVADALASDYPQVRVVFHSRSVGWIGAVRTGLQRARGDVIFLRDDPGTLVLDEIRKLWHAIDEHPMVLGRADVAESPRRWIGWKRRETRRDPQGGFRMIDRQVLRDVQSSLEEQVMLVADLAQAGMGWHEVAVAARAASNAASIHARHARRREAGQSSCPSESPRPSVGEPSRPNYARRVKDFASGE